MSIQQTQIPSTQPVPLRRSSGWLHLRRNLFCLSMLLISGCLSGASALSASEVRTRGMAMIVAGWNFDLLSWEVNALTEKLRALLNQPAHGLTYAEAVGLVQDYLARAQKIRKLENEISSSFSENQRQSTPEVRELQAQVTALRASQQHNRPTVEQILEGQITYELRREGLQWANMAFPPVQFTFVEPPRKLVISPRTHITTIYTQMLAAEMSIDQIEQSEAAYQERDHVSAYITNIGGLGAFPTMVIDQASLAWVLSTIAHEWTHNYLTLFPLGINYLTSPDLMTINETVADIVGNEIGDRALHTFYPGEVPPPVAPPTVTTPTDPDAPPPFVFAEEMRATRIQVDNLLALGKVEEAERYMEARRLVFVDHGYRLRVLNQAYFAFHGSYGTSPASTSPLGPKLTQLRRAMPDLPTFLQAVRGITSVAELDAILIEWQANPQ